MPTTTQTTMPAPWSAPYLQSLWSGATQVANRPYQPYMAPRVAGLSDLQTNALGGIQGAMMGNPTTWAGMNQLGNIIQNQGNPYESQVAQTIADDAGKAFDSKVGQLNEIFSNPNSFGNARHALGASQLTEDFGRGLGQSLGNLRYGQYNTGLDRSMQAAGQAQNMTSSQMGLMQQGLLAGSLPQSVQQRLYDTGYQDYQNWWNYPQQQAQFLGGIMGMGNPGSVTSQQTPDPNRSSQIWGGALTALGAMNGMGLFNGGGNYLNGFTGYDSFGGPAYG